MFYGREFRLNYFLSFFYVDLWSLAVANSRKVRRRAGDQWTNWIAALVRSGRHLGMPQ